MIEQKEYWKQICGEFFMDHTGLAVAKTMLCRKGVRCGQCGEVSPDHCPSPSPSVKLGMEAEVWRPKPQSFGNGTDDRHGHHLLLGPWPL